MITNLNSRNCFSKLIAFKDNSIELSLIIIEYINTELYIKLTTKKI